LAAFICAKLRLAIITTIIRRWNAINETGQCGAGIGNDMNVGRPCRGRLQRIDIDPYKTDGIVPAPFDDRVKEPRADCEGNIDAGPQVVADLHGLREWMPDVQRTKSMFAHDHRCLHHLGQSAQFGLGAEHATADKDSWIAGAPEQCSRARNGVGVGLRRTRF
jgi:hypothetical protein